MANGFKGFLEVYECYVHWDVLCIRSYHDSSQYVSLLVTPTTYSEACLVVSYQLIDRVLYSVQKYSVKDFGSY